MFRGFFQSREWRNRLITAGVTSLGSGAMAALQDADVINARRQGMPIGIGLLTGSAANTYLTGNNIPEPSNINFASLITFLNIGISLAAAPFFEGDQEKAKAWSGMTLSCFFLGLAACIKPAQGRMPAVTQPQLSNSIAEIKQAKVGPTFRERFKAIKNPLVNMIETEERNTSNIEPVNLQNLKSLNSAMEEFETKYQNSEYELINDPITIPESGSVCDRTDLEKNIKAKIFTCPKTAIPLTVSRTQRVQTTLMIRDLIDETLKKFEDGFKKIQTNLAENSLQNSESRSSVSLRSA